MELTKNKNKSQEGAKTATYINENSCILNKFIAVVGM